MIARMLDSAMTVFATATQDLRAVTAQPRFAPMVAPDTVSALLTTSHASATLDGLVMIVH